VSIVELLRNDWTGGISAGLAWLGFLQVARQLPPLEPRARKMSSLPLRELQLGGYAVEMAA
jgi:hypothetical protein